MNDLVHVWCYECRDNFPMRQSVYDGLEKCGNTFYCPSGHSLIVSRESIVLQMRSTRRSLELRSERVNKLEKQASAFRGMRTRQLNRLLRGDCPYCGKTPHDMTKHIQERHSLKVSCRQRSS